MKTLPEIRWFAVWFMSSILVSFIVCTTCEKIWGSQVTPACGFAFSFGIALGVVQAGLQRRRILRQWAAQLTEEITRKQLEDQRHNMKLTLVLVQQAKLAQLALVDLHKILGKGDWLEVRIKGLEIALAPFAGIPEELTRTLQ